MKKHGLRVAGICAGLAIGITLLAVASAQAEVGAHWNVNGAAISKTLLPNFETELEGNHLVLLTHILGSPVETLCTAMHFEEGVLKEEGSTLGKVRFSGCIQKVNGTVQSACEPHNGAEKGVILTKLLKGLIVLHTLATGTVDSLYRIEPEEGSVWVTTETSTECSVGSKISLLGTLYLGDCAKELAVEKVVHLLTAEGCKESTKCGEVEESMPTELWYISKTTEHKVTVDGSLNVSLVREHEGLKWSGTPA